MSSETLKEYGVHAVSIAVIAYAMVTPVTVSDFWCLGGAAALSLTFEVIRRARPVTPPTVPTTEPLDTARTMLDRSMSAVESLAEHLLRPPELLPPKSAATPKADAEGDGSDENGSDDEHFESQTRGWLVGISRMLAMCMSSYQWLSPFQTLYSSWAKSTRKNGKEQKSTQQEARNTPSTVHSRLPGGMSP